MKRFFSNTPPPKDSRELWKHFAGSYFSMRTGLVVLAFGMPLVLYLFGKFWHGLDLQPSMSAYFWAATEEQCATFPMRTIFVGFLFAIGVGLYLYKGLTPLENTLLNVAAVCAAVVATFPERIPAPNKVADERLKALYEHCKAVAKYAESDQSWLHLIAAVVLFVLLAAVAWLCAEKSLEYLPAGHDAGKYRRRYKAIAIAMILFPIPGLAVAFLLGLWPQKVFFVEAAGVVTFGVYWAVKSRELSLSELQKDPPTAVQHASGREASKAK